MNLIFIHGRAQEGKNPEVLRNLWINTFKIGLEKSNLLLPIQEDKIFFPFYGDKLDTLVNSINQPIEEIVKKGSEQNNKDVFELIKANKASDKSDCLETSRNVGSEEGSSASGNEDNSDKHLVSRSDGERIE